MFSFKLRHRSQEAKYSLLSMLSLAGVLILHFIHWLAAPFMIGVAAEMHAHHHGSGGEGGGGDSLLLSSLMMLLYIVNVVSVYFAVRQLIAAFRLRTKHAIVCSGISVVVLGIVIYTMAAM